MRGERDYNLKFSYYMTVTNPSELLLHFNGGLISVRSLFSWQTALEEEKCELW